MKEFKYEKLNITDSRSFDLNEGSKYFLFTTGKSYFKAFEIPQDGYPFHLLIKSYMLGEHITEGHIFYPYLIILNEKFKVIRSTIPHCLNLKKI